MSETPYSISWYVPQRVIFIKYHGDLPLAAFHGFNAVFLEMLEEGSAPVHILADIRAIGKVNENPMNIKSALTYLEHPRLGWINLCGTNVFIRFIASIVFQFMKVRIRFHDTLEGGVDFIKTIDDSLQNIPAPSESMP